VQDGDKSVAADQQKSTAGQPVIAVMGPTGSGKSTFINYVADGNGSGVGHGLLSQTAEVHSVRATHPTSGVGFTFVDIPGFDDTHKSDMEILIIIAEWLVETYKTNLNLVGLIYLHRISDLRMGGSLLKNLELFISLCGREAMPKVVVVTTMWSKVAEAVEERREEELKRTFWKEMIDAGCRTERFMDTQESAWDIVDNLISNPSGGNILLLTEIVDHHRRLNETTAGITLNKQLEKLIQDKKTASRKLQQVKKQANPKVVEDLTKEQMKIDERIDQIVGQLHQLRMPFTRRVQLFFSSKPS